MTCKYNYKNISLKADTYHALQEISSQFNPGEKVSPAKTIDNLVYFWKVIKPQIRQRQKTDDYQKKKTS